MRRLHDEYEIDEDARRLDLALMHGWLTRSYWSPGVSRETVERAARGSSLVVGAYHGDTQVGCLRVVSDRATFAWIADVYVEPAHRGKGLGKAMIRFALEHPQHQNLRRWLLTTRDAHAVYGESGFKPLPHPERFMMLRAPDPPTDSK